MPIPITYTLGDQMVAEMLARAQDQSMRYRQQDAATRLLMLKENWRDSIAHMIAARYPDDEQVPLEGLRAALRRRSSLTLNVIKRLTDTVCFSYKSVPERTLEGASDRATKAWGAILEQSQISTKAKEIERYAWALNVLMVVPVVRDDMSGGGKRLDLDWVFPHHAEVQHDASDPMGTPSSMTYSTRVGSDRTGGENPLTWVVLDRETFRYYDPNGKLLQTVEHGAGVFPGVDFRFSHPVDDFWDSTRGEGIVDATLNVAHLGCRMEWVRDMQDRMREILWSKKDIPPQFLGGVMHIRDQPGESAYQVANAITSPEGHLAQMKHHYHQGAESVGVPSVLVDFEAGAGNAANTNPIAAANVHAALTEVRNDHIGWLTPKEKRLWYVASLVMRGMGHPAATELKPDMVADSFRLKFGELAFVDHPKTKLEVWEAEIKMGILSVYRAYMRAHPTCRDIEEAREKVQQIAVEEGELDQFYIHHAIPRDPSQRSASRSELLGQIGGEASGVARQPDDDDEPIDEATTK